MSMIIETVTIETESGPVVINKSDMRKTDIIYGEKKESKKKSKKSSKKMG